MKITFGGLLSAFGLATPRLKIEIPEPIDDVELSAMVPLTLSESKVDLIQEKLRAWLGRPVKVVKSFDGFYDGLPVQSAYVFEERRGDYCWRAVVWSLDDLLKITDWCCGLASNMGQIPSARAIRHLGLHEEDA